MYVACFTALDYIVFSEFPISLTLQRPWKINEILKKWQHFVKKMLTKYFRVNSEGISFYLKLCFIWERKCVLQSTIITHYTEDKSLYILLALLV